ncbi:LOW QUALITY PROTEIN: hypothetical protein SETIT_3G229200v2 [Setaria italica]|uniref:SKP1 component POZ domain-containing protein n=1 Tax=Setaria italica TaxID=4555 RepID=A0A368QHU8_SETIT|nr:LOW QUALITY PROTEIN: hypothetical protein SETIT_3G229200v2 [Setaria italica]
MRRPGGHDHAHELGQRAFRGGGSGGDPVADHPPHDRGHGCTDGGVPLPNITGKILAMVLEYCNKHAPAEATGTSSSLDAAATTTMPKDHLKSFDEAFVDVDQATLFDLILATNYLDIKGLLDITCQKVANTIKDKSPEEELGPTPSPLLPAAACFQEVVPWHGGGDSRRRGDGELDGMATGSWATGGRVAGNGDGGEPRRRGAGDLRAGQ